MIPTKSYAVQNAGETLSPFDIERRSPGPHDVEIDIMYCGVCHTDIHLINNDWGISIYPMVPGHEIIGRIVNVGNHVTKFKSGDIAGVGCLVDSCRNCEFCDQGLEQYCAYGAVYTYSAYEKDGKTITFGGYSSKIVVDERFVLKVPSNLPAHKAVPCFALVSLLTLL
jgi:uncharacterized zinc-type alcohol dehydrogenase-like protein